MFQLSFSAAISALVASPFVVSCSLHFIALVGMSCNLQHD